MRYKEAVGTVEFYNNVDGSISLNLIEDIPSNFPQEIAENIRNLQYAVLYAMLTNADEFEATGSVFRAGIQFGQEDAPAEPMTEPPTENIDDATLMAPVHYLEKYLKGLPKEDG